MRDWAASAAGWARGTGLLTGWADDAFQPQAELTRAEAAVLRALAGNRAGKTVLLVSHRPSAAAIADATYSVEHGRVS